MSAFHAHILEAKFSRRRRKGPTFHTLRNAEVRRVLADRYGATLPNDDAGAGDLLLALAVRAPRGEGEPELRRYCRALAPWLPDAEMLALVASVYEKPRRFTSQQLGLELNLNASDRERLGIKTIAAADLTPAQRAARRNVRKAQRRKERRRAAGVKDQALSASRLQPWAAFGWSRRTWYRRGRPVPETWHNSDANKLTDVLGDKVVPPGAGAYGAEAASLRSARPCPPAVPIEMQRPANEWRVAA